MFECNLDAIEMFENAILFRNARMARRNTPSSWPFNLQQSFGCREASTFNLHETTVWNLFCGIFHDVERCYIHCFIALLNIWCWTFSEKRYCCDARFQYLDLISFQNLCWQNFREIVLLRLDYNAEEKIYEAHLGFSHYSSRIASELSAKLEPFYNVLDRNAILQ